VTCQAITCLNLICSLNYTPALDLSLVLLRPYPTITEAHVANLHIPDAHVPMLQPLIDLVCYRFEIEGVLCPIECYRSHALHDAVLSAAALAPAWPTPALFEEDRRVLEF
jgi:hypothetical protein